MSVHLVTFASPEMSKSAELCASSARAHGVDTVFDWRLEELRDTKLYREHEALFSKPRGVGYWAWKPFIVLDRVCRLFDGPNPDHVVVYADAGVEFIEPVQTVIDLMDQDIWLFGNEHQHAHWCKRDIVEAVWPRHEYRVTAFGEFPSDEWAGSFDKNVLAWQPFGKQAQASVIFFRVNDYTRKFVKEWLDWCLFEGGRLIDDSPSRTPNHPEFKENRHDQAILTTMAYREGIKLHEWFVRYEGYTPGRMTGYPQELERPFVFHHRRRNHEWEGVAA